MVIYLSGRTIKILFVHIFTTNCVSFYSSILCLTLNQFNCKILNLYLRLMLSSLDNPINHDEKIKFLSTKKFRALC